MISIFTLGTNHEPGPIGAYVLVTGADPDLARRLMAAIRQEKWAFQYDGSVAIEQISRWGLRCVQSIHVHQDEESASLSPDENELAASLARDR